VPVLMSLLFLSFFQLWKRPLVFMYFKEIVLAFLQLDIMQAPQDTEVQILTILALSAKVQESYGMIQRQGQASAAPFP